MKYIKIFQNAQALSVSLENSYSEDQLMHTFLDNFHQGEKFYSQIASHQAELSSEERFADQKYLFISSLQTDYLNQYRSSGLKEIVREQVLSRQSARFMEVLVYLQKNNIKGSERKMKKLVRLVIWTTDKRNARLINVLDMYLNIC